MHAVVVLPPPNTLGDVESFRRLHDPTFHRSAAHVLLVPPFDGSDPSIPGKFDHVPSSGPIGVTFGEPEVRGHELVLPVARGRVALERLRAALLEALRDPLDAAEPLAPALRIGLLTTEAERELARRSFGNSAPPQPFKATTMTLLLEDERGIWHPVRTRALG